MALAAPEGPTRNTFSARCTKRQVASSRSVGAWIRGLKEKSKVSRVLSGARPLLVSRRPAFEVAPLRLVGEQGVELAVTPLPPAAAVARSGCRVPESLRRASLGRALSRMTLLLHAILGRRRSGRCRSNRTPGEAELDLAVGGRSGLFFRQPVQFMDRMFLTLRKLGVAKWMARRQAASRRCTVYLSASLISARTGRMPSTALSAKTSWATRATDERRAHCSNPSWVQVPFQFLGSTSDLPQLGGAWMCGDRSHLWLPGRLANQAVGDGVERLLAGESGPTLASLHTTWTARPAVASRHPLPRSRTAPAAPDLLDDMQIVAVTVPVLQLVDECVAIGGLVAALLLGLAEQRQEVALDVFYVSFDASVPDGKADREKSGIRNAARAGDRPGSPTGPRRRRRSLPPSDCPGSPFGHAAEPLEGVDVTGEKGLLLLIKDHLAVRPAGVAQPAREHPGAPPRACSRPGEPQVPEIDLHHLARLRLAALDRSHRRGNWRWNSAAPWSPSTPPPAFRATCGSPGSCSPRATPRSAPGARRADAGGPPRRSAARVYLLELLLGR